jgi:hypothetical protein
MSLPVEYVAAVGERLAGYDLTPPRSAILITPSSSAMARLQRLHAAAGRLAENASEIIAHPEAAKKCPTPIPIRVDGKISPQSPFSTRAQLF